MSDLDWVNDDPVDLRRAYAAGRAALDATAPPDVAVIKENRAGIAGLYFTPLEGAKRTPILYFHGGSWMLGSPATHRALCAWLSKLSSRRVISVSYPLAPEHPWPAQPLAARACLAAALSLEEGPVFVAGDSAGGSMALWSAQDNCATVRGIAAFYPSFGLTNSHSIDTFGPDNAALNAEAIDAMYDRLGVDPHDVQMRCRQTGRPR